MVQSITGRGRRGAGWLALLALVLLLAAAPAWGASYFVYQQWGGTWQDANKTAANTEDDLMCWAAAASNVLAWAGWGTPTYNTTDKIFKHFQDHWTDNTGVPAWAWKWWLNGSPPPYYFASYPDVPGGGNFYPTLNFTSYYSSGSNPDLMVSAELLMRQGYGVTLIIGRPGGSHAVTAWGFDYTYDPLTKKNLYSGIYITDSDDGVLGLKYYPITKPGAWWTLGGSYSGWQIGLVQAFRKRASLIQIPFGAFPDELDVAVGVAPVPLPATWPLVASGFLLILLGRRRA